MFLVLLVVALVASWCAIALVNDTRAYATGEGRYSKAEKMAVLDLYRYANSGDERDYSAFLDDLAVPLGDRAARAALTRYPPDYRAAEIGFLKGQNHPDDIGGLIQLFRWFSWWQPFAAARADWRIGDEQILQLMAQGRILHASVAKTGRSGGDVRILSRIAALDRLMTRLENTFSTHMGDAARRATLLVVTTLGASTVILWGIGAVFAARLLRRRLLLDHQLAASEERFRDFAEIASDWYWETDSCNRISYASDRLYRLVRASPVQVIGRPAEEILRTLAIGGDHAQDCLLAMIEKRPFRNLTLHLLQTERYFAISGKPIFTGNDEFAGYRGVGTDVTAQFSDALALRVAKDHAEVANRAKSAFLANMSHELRTPLNAILGFSDVIRSRMFGDGAIDRYADYARDIHASGAHLLSIVSDVLDLSRIEAGRDTLVEGWWDLGATVDEARVLLGEQYHKPDIAFEVRLPASSPSLRVDQRKVVQILINLLSNAFKFTPPGGSVTLDATVLSDGRLQLDVRDTGIGIAPSQIETVLSPFGQVESAFQRKHHGTGLGLPLARALVELHGGTLVIESVEGHGTTISVCLPASRVRFVADKSAAVG